ncbi:YncE family protein [Adhaeribacter terreus]|uniref:YncE family protein n=1 Tax=Adhaeribacter terreus TaxID=529703 RepID=A0ABW0E9V6_9BACT
MRATLTPFQKLLLLLGFLLLSMHLNSCKHTDPEEVPEPFPIFETGKIYVANEHAGTISVIDAATNKVLKTININEGNSNALMAHNVQVAPDGNTVWVTGVPMDHTTDEKLVIIDAKADSVIYRKNMGVHLHMAHVVLDSQSKFAYVTGTEAGLVLQINTQTFHTSNVYTLPANHQPHGLRYYNGKLYVANLEDKSISVIDVSTGQITEIPVGGMAVQTAISQDGKYVFASLFDTKEVVRYNLQTQTLDRISLPAIAQGPIQLYPTPDSKKFFVCDQGVLLNRPVSDKVFVIDIEKAAVTNTINVGNAAHGVVVSKSGKTAYSTNTNDGTVSVIDVALEKVIATIPVGFTPNGISFLSETGGMP